MKSRASGFASICMAVPSSGVRSGARMSARNEPPPVELFGADATAEDDIAPVRCVAVDTAPPSASDSTRGVGEVETGAVPVPGVSEAMSGDGSAGWGPVPLATAPRVADVSETAAA